MPGMTAEIAAGTADLWEDGIRPTNLLWLTEDDDYVPMWTLIEVYRALYGHQPVPPREPTDSTTHPVRWLSGDPDRMLRDGLLMLALHVFRMEGVVAAAEDTAPALTDSDYLPLWEVDQPRLAELDELCMATEFPGKLALTVLEGSMLNDQLPILADYPVELEVCTVTYSHTWGGFGGRTREEAEPVGSLTAGWSSAGPTPHRARDVHLSGSLSGIEFGPRFDRALERARAFHRGQPRKGSQIPYIGHLLGVAAIVIDEGGTEDEVIAALLHDAAEDRGGTKTLELIETEFGPEVRAIVADLSDTLEHPKPPWRKRKQAYLAHLEDASPSVLRISLADKLYNARSIVLDHARVGDEVWKRFKGSPDESLWYYRSLAEIFQRRLGGALADEFSRVVSTLAELVED